MGRHSVIEAPVASAIGTPAGASPQVGPDAGPVSGPVARPVPGHDPRTVPGAPPALAGAARVLAPVPAPRRSVTGPLPVPGAPAASRPSPAPAVALAVAPPTAARAQGWPELPVPPGFHAPPAGLDAPLPPAGPRRASVGAWVGAAGAGVALLVVAGAALGALADAASATATGPTAPTIGSGSTGGAPTAAAERCSDTVATMLDDTVEELTATPSSTWAASVSARQDVLAAGHGAGSAEYAAYTDGVSEIVAWLSDPATTESYDSVVNRVVPRVVAACDRAHV